MWPFSFNFSHFFILLPQCFGGEEGGGGKRKRLRGKGERSAAGDVVLELGLASSNRRAVEGGKGVREERKEEMGGGILKKREGVVRTFLSPFTVRGKKGGGKEGKGGGNSGGRKERNEYRTYTIFIASLSSWGKINIRKSQEKKKRREGKTEEH